jgi:hypothetical protein
MPPLFPGCGICVIIRSNAANGVSCKKYLAIRFSVLSFADNKKRPGIRPSQIKLPAFALFPVYSVCGGSNPVFE